MLHNAKKINSLENSALGQAIIGVYKEYKQIDIASRAIIDKLCNFYDLDVDLIFDIEEEKAFTVRRYIYTMFVETSRDLAVNNEIKTKFETVKRDLRNEYFGQSEIEKIKEALFGHLNSKTYINDVASTELSFIAKACNKVINFIGNDINFIEWLSKQELFEIEDSDCLIDRVKYYIYKTVFEEENKKRRIKQKFNFFGLFKSKEEKEEQSIEDNDFKIKYGIKDDYYIRETLKIETDLLNSLKLIPFDFLVDYILTDVVDLEKMEDELESIKLTRKSKVYRFGEKLDYADDIEDNGDFNNIEKEFEERCWLNGEEYDCLGVYKAYKNQYYDYNKFDYDKVIEKLCDLNGLTVFYLKIIILHYLYSNYINNSENKLNYENN